MTPATPSRANGLPRFDVAITHHRLTRGVAESADRRLPAGLEPTVRGAFALADTLTLRLVGAPDDEPPVTVHRLRVQAMTDAGDLLRGGLAVSMSAGPLGADVLRNRLGPLGDVTVAAVRQPAAPPALKPRFDPLDSLYPLAAEARNAPDAFAPWLLPLPGDRVRAVRFAAPAAWSADHPMGADPFWTQMVADAGFGEVAAESRIAAEDVAFRWHAERPRALLTVAARATAHRLFAAVA